MTETQSTTDIKDKFDLTIIGGGPGGYVAAIRASQLGLRVAVVEKDKMGGVCLNWGCIPTKALLQSAHTYHAAKHSETFGVKANGVSVDFTAVVGHSRKVAETMAGGVDFLMKKNKITVISGRGFLRDSQTVEVLDAQGNILQTIKTEHTIVATGARSKALPFLPYDGDKVISSKEAMVLPALPATLAIIGAGAIGVEFADVYASLGTKVMIIEALPHLLPNEDEEVSKALERSFKKRGIEFHTSTKVLSAKVGGKVDLELEDEKGNRTTMSADRVLVAVGVAPNTENLGLEELGVKTSRGFVDVDKYYRTTVPNVYAIGDCIATPLLAHVASSEGIRAVEDISIRKGNPHKLEFDFLNYNAIPGCTYCHPEVASVGYTEKKAKEEGLDFSIGRVPYTANGKARAVGDVEGFVKILVDKKTQAILGAHIFGTNATEMINEYTLAMHNELRAVDIARTIHAHPTISELLMETAEASIGHAIHI